MLLLEIFKELVRSIPPFGEKKKRDSRIFPFETTETTGSVTYFLSFLLNLNLNLNLFHLLNLNLVKIRIAAGEDNLLKYLPFSYKMIL
jgi:hypothetical protein